MKDDPNRKPKVLNDKEKRFMDGMDATFDDPQFAEDFMKEAEKQQAEREAEQAEKEKAPKE